jgi:hypothetical protein
VTRPGRPKSDRRQFVTLAGGLAALVKSVVGRHSTGRPCALASSMAGRGPYKLCSSIDRVPCCLLVASDARQRTDASRPLAGRERRGRAGLRGR